MHTNKQLGGGECVQLRETSTDDFLLVWKKCATLFQENYIKAQKQVFTVF